MNRHPKEVATFIDAYEQERVIHRAANGELHVKRQGSTVTLDLGRAIGIYVGIRIREERRKRGWSMIHLAERAGIKGNKTRVAEIEKHMSGGIKIGTLYAIAAALGVRPIDLLPEMPIAMKESGVSMVGDIRLYTRDEIDRMLRAVDGPVGLVR